MISLAAAALCIVVHSTDGSALPGTTVFVTTREGDARKEFTNARGEIILDRMPLGAADVRVVLYGYGSTHVTVCVDDSDEQRVITVGTDHAWFGTEPMEIAGTIAGDRDEPIPGALVRILDDKGVVAVAPADRDGRFHFASMPPREYSVRAEAIGFDAGESRYEGQGYRLNLQRTCR